MMEYTRTEITICGKRYPIKVLEDPEYVKDLARQLDVKLNRLIDENPKMNVTTALIFIALEMANDNLEANAKLDNIRTQIKTYVEEAAAARIECNDAKKQLEEGKRRIFQLETDLQMKRLQDDVNQ